MEQKSNLVKLVENWSKSCNAPVLETPQTPSKERVELSERLIKEESKEFSDAISRDSVDLEEVCDSLGDTLWVVIRAFQEFGIDPDKVIREVYRSNMSKICQTEEEAEKSCELYASGEHPNKKGEEIDCFYEKIENSSYFVVKRKSDEKVMKSYKFEEPDFSKIIK
jgi:predicted HAD superfamily Cof-like phosphohydrolase